MTFGSPAGSFVLGQAVGSRQPLTRGASAGFRAREEGALRRAQAAALGPIPSKDDEGMNALVLIDSVVRQVTVLIGQLATSGGIRAPLAHLANHVFLELATELEAQGVSRKVSADMFGMALRAYIRKVGRLREGQTEQGRTLWQAVLDFIRHERLVTRDRLLERFARDGDREVSGVLRDLIDSGVVFCSGSGRSAVLRVATDDELGELSQLTETNGLDELAWVLTYRHGPVTAADLAKLLRRDLDRATEILERLGAAGRVHRTPSGAWAAQDFVIPLGSSSGWEAAVFDHLQAVVQTICQRLRQVSFDTEQGPTVGGSTYSFDVWPGHPLEEEVKQQLTSLRQRLGDLRQRVDAYNREQGLPDEHQQVITYVGQCVMDRERFTGDGEHQS